METIRPLALVDDAWEGQFVINEGYRPIAQALVKKFDELRHIDVKDIIFLEDTKTKAMSKGRIKYAQIGKMPKRWQEAIYQLTGYLFNYYMEIYKVNTSGMTPAQITALIYHELRHINRFGDLVGHDIEDWENMVFKLGTHWEQADVPDLLAPDVNWNNICGLGQQRLFRDLMPEGIEKIEIRKAADNKQSEEEQMGSQDIMQPDEDPDTVERSLRVVR